MLRRRHLLLGLLAILAVLVVFVVLEIHWAMTARPDRDTDYGARVDAMVAARQGVDASEPNRWPEFVAAIRAFFASYDRVRKAGTQPATYPSGFLWPADFDAVRSGAAGADVLASTESTIAAIAADPGADFGPGLDALIGRRHFVRLSGGSVQPLYEVLLPELGEARQLARHELLMLQRAYRADKPDAAGTHLARVLLLARVIGMQGFLIDQAVGDVLRNQAFEELAALMIERPPTLAMIDAIASAAEAQFPGFEGPAFFVEGERVFPLDVMQRTFESSGYGRGRFIASEAISLPFVSQGSSVGFGALPRDSRLQNMLWFRYASRAQTEDKLREYYDLVDRHLSAPPAARKDLPSLDQYAQDLPARYAVLRLTMPALSGAIMKSRVASDQLRALGVVLAIERYRLARGEAPEELGGLVPEFLASVPTSEIGGGPFLYRRLDAPDAHGRVYLLYLPGLDEVDNAGAEVRPAAAEAALAASYPGGTLADPYVAVLNQRAAEGLDFIFNRPRQRAAK